MEKGKEGRCGNRIKMEISEGMEELLKYGNRVREKI